jgi:hypothetical protein
MTILYICMKKLWIVNRIPLLSGARLCQKMLEPFSTHVSAHRSSWEQMEPSTLVCLSASIAGMVRTLDHGPRIYKRAYLPFQVCPDDRSLLGERSSQERLNHGVYSRLRGEKQFVLNFLNQRGQRKAKNSERAHWWRAQSIHRVHSVLIVPGPMAKCAHRIEEKKKTFCARGCTSVHSVHSINRKYVFWNTFIHTCCVFVHTLMITLC